MNLTQCKRVVLFNLVTDAAGEPEAIEFRHYGISARQRSINKSIKRLINNKSKQPNLSRYDDLADFIYSRGGGYSSESEVDDIPESKLVLPSDFQDKKKNSSVALKLHELGPRLKLKLVKIEEGLGRGNVVYHAFVKKSKKEIKEQMDEVKRKRELKAERKRVQEENVKRKQEEKAGGKGVKFEEVPAEEAQEENVEYDEGKDARAMPKKKEEGGRAIVGKKRARFTKK